MKQQNRTIPTVVTREQLRDACVAFCDALGFSAELGLYPLVVTPNEVHFPAAILDEDRRKMLVRSQGHEPPQDNPGQILSSQVTITVTPAWDEESG